MNSTVAISAAPIGRPGWPEFACLDRVHRQRADGVGHAVVFGARGRIMPAGKAEAWARAALAAARRSGMVMRLANGTPVAVQMQPSEVTGTGRAQITWGAAVVNSAAASRASVMHRPAAARKR